MLYKAKSTKGIFMETSNQQPCMNTLRIKVLARMWSSLPQDSDCAARRSISQSLQELCIKHPEGGKLLLAEIVSLCKDSKSCCDIEETKVWDYLEELASNNDDILNH